MSSLVRAELIKLRSTRMPLWLLLTALGLVVLLVFVTVPTGDGSDALSLHDSDLLARVVGVGTAAGQVVMLVLGILSFTQEFRFGTATSTFLVAPARRRVLAGEGSRARRRRVGLRGGDHDPQRRSQRHCHRCARRSDRVVWRVCGCARGRGGCHRPLWNDRSRVGRHHS